MEGEPTVNRGSLDSLLARRTGRFSRKVEQETTQEMVDPLSEGWVDLLSEGKKEKRRQVERKLFPFLLWVVKNRHKTHGGALLRIWINPRSRFPLQLPSPIASNPIRSIPDSKERKRRQVERYLFPCLLWLVTNRDETHGAALPPEPDHSQRPISATAAKPSCIKTNLVHSGFKRKREMTG